MTIPRPNMFTESDCSRAPSNPVLQILIFLAVFIVISIAEGICTSVFALPAMLSKLLSSGEAAADFQQSYEIAMSVTSDANVMIPMLFSTVFGTVISIIFCRFIEQRPLSSIGIRREHAVSHYLRGLLTGFILMSLITGLTVLTGAAEISAASDINFGIILLYFSGWLIQGMSEEFIFRGYLMNTIGGKHSAAAALAVSSIAFSLAHISNPGVSPLALINLILFAVFAGLYMICFDDIWGACAIHSVWNFTQGNVFGISVSGNGSCDSILRTTAVSESALLTGGDFGIEGSIFTTIVLAAAAAILLIRLAPRKSRTHIL